MTRLSRISDGRDTGGCRCFVNNRQLRCAHGLPGHGRVPRRAPAARRPVHPRSASASTARSVSSPGSPGPAPRKVTCPWAGRTDGSMWWGSSCSLPHKTGRTLGQHLGRRARVRAPRCLRATQVRDRWWTSAPARSRRCVPTTPRRRISVTADCPSARTSASAPTGALQPASRAASRDRSAVTAARVYGSSSSASEATRVGVRRHALDCQGPLAGGGQDHVDRQELGHLCGPADPAEPGRGEHHRVELAARGRSRCGCRCCRGSGPSRCGARGCERTRSAAPCGAASRYRSGRRRGSSLEASARPGRPARPGGPRARGIAASTRSLGLRGRQVLQGVHGEVDLARSAARRAAR